tara:strand:- start:384 stop:1208 length:825 start_codon:yes stop_codon:yes gene_type:complete
MTIVCLNGRYLDEKKAKVSVLDAGFFYGEGIYETLRTKQGKLLNLEGHLARLKRSADLVQIPLPSLKKLSSWLQATVDKNGFWKKGKESRVRLTVSGGVHGYDAPSKNPTILITVAPLEEVPKQKRMRGVAAVTYKIDRPLPIAKTTNLLPSMIARRFMRIKKAYEVFLVDHLGYVTEGSISNIFMVKRGKLITPKSSALPGTTQERILKLARRQKWPLVRRDFKVKELYGAHEVFFTNAPRGVVPVVKVDGRKIGNGKVGPVTKRAWDALKAF